MSKSETTSRATFLREVRQQLRPLELADQREILAELAAHLEDAIAARTTATGVAAEAEAVRAMGAPATLGRRLRDEHLSQRFSLRGALLNALPLLLTGILLSRTELRSFVHNLSSASNGFPASFLFSLAPLGVIALWLLRRTRQTWPATALGGICLLALLGVTHADGIVSHGARGLVWLALIALATIPITLGFALRWGSFRATLAILGGVGAYGCYAWLGDDRLAPTLAIALWPVLGVLALGLTARRWRPHAAWVVFGGNWIAILLAAFYYQHIFRSEYIDQLKAQPGYIPSQTYHLPSLHVAGMVSPLFLVGSAALLGAVQLVTRLQANGRLSLRWAR